MTEDRLAPPTFDPADAAAAAARFAATAPADVALRAGRLAHRHAGGRRHRRAASPPSPTRTSSAAPTRVLDWLAARLSPRILEAPARLDDVRRELDEYFEGRRRDFDLPIDWTLTSPFGRRVLKATAAIPFGRVSTYGEMAAQAGNAKASRAAGRALGANPIPIVVPCHRVIGASGRLTGYTGGLHRKVALLEIEGVVLPG